MPHFGFSSTFKGHLLLGRDRVPRETFGFVAPQFTDGRYLLAPDDVCATSISVKTALNGM